MHFHELGPANADRAAELTHRTTQFNTSGERWNAGQLKTEVSAGRLIAVLAEVEDRYGSYGIVGLMLLRRESPEASPQPELDLARVGAGTGATSFHQASRA